MDAQICAKLMQIVCTQNYEKTGVRCVRRVISLENNNNQELKGVRLGVISNTFSNTLEAKKTYINQTPNTYYTSNTSKNDTIGTKFEVGDFIYMMEEWAGGLQGNPYSKIDAEWIAYLRVLENYEHVMKPEVRAQLDAYISELIPDAFLPID